jgi:hypothetical protein
MARLQALEHKGRGAVADEVSSPAADEAQVSDNGGEQVVDKVPTGDEAQAVDEAPTGDGAPVSKQVQAEAEVAGGLETHHWHQALLSLREGQRALLERLEVLEAKAAGGDGLGVDGAGEGTERLEAELARSQQERLAIKELQNGLMATVADLAAEMVAFRLASEAQPDVPESGRLAELVEQVQQEVARSQEERLAIKELQNGLTVTVADLSAEMVAFRMAAMEGQLMANGGDESHAERLADLEEKHQAMAAAVDEMTTELKEIHQGFGQVQGLSHSTAIAVTGLTQDFQLMCRQMEAFEGLCARLDKELAGLGPGPRRSGSPSHPVRLVRDSNGRTSGVEGRTESMSPPSDERKPITLS